MNQQEENFKLVVTKEDILNRLIDSVDREYLHPATLARKKDRDSLFSRIGFLEEKYLLGIRIRMNDLYQQFYRKYLGKQYIQEIAIYRNEKFPHYHIPVHALSKNTLKEKLLKRVIDK